MGLIKKIGTAKILMTFEGKQESERSKQSLNSYVTSGIMICQLYRSNRTSPYFIRAIVQFSYRRLTWNNISDEIYKIFLSEEPDNYMSK